MAPSNVPVICVVLERNIKVDVLVDIRLLNLSSQSHIKPLKVFLFIKSRIVADAHSVLVSVVRLSRGYHHYVRNPAIKFYCTWFEYLKNVEMINIFESLDC